MGQTTNKRPRPRTALLVAAGLAVVVAAVAVGAWAGARPRPVAVGAVDPPESPIPPDATPTPPPAPARATTWYVPAKADFRPEYDRDAADRARQSWDDYWLWVGQFYAGNFFTPGWTRQSADLIDGVRAGEVRDELRAALNALGRRAAAEWAKDNGVRKLNTNDLLLFGKRLRQAKADDDGSGTTLRAAIGAVRAEVETKLSRP